MGLRDKYRNLSPIGIVLAASIYDTARDLLAPAEIETMEGNGIVRFWRCFSVASCVAASSRALRWPVRGNGSAGGNKGAAISPGLSGTKPWPPSGSGKQDRGSIG